MIRIIVSKKIDVDINLVRELLSNYAEYSRWWRLPVKMLEDKGNSFQITPIPFVQIELEEQFSKKENEIKFKYTKGPFRGYGCWNLKKKGEMTLVCYSIELTPINTLIDALTRNSLFAWKHRRDIKNIINEITVISDRLKSK